MSTFDKVKTEDTGKVFEYAICLTYNTPYDGVYRYSTEDAQILVPRLQNLPELLPNMKHTASKGARYDFQNIDQNSKLSAKSTKKSGKVAPQIIGQCSPQAFCTHFDNINFISNEQLKIDIQNSLNIPKILDKMMEFTFTCPVIYLNKKSNKIKYITLKEKIEWENYIYSWTRSHEKWTNSTTLHITKNHKKKSIVEFQFHSKSRSNMAIRWNFEKLIDIFQDHFEIIEM